MAIRDTTQLGAAIQLERKRQGLTQKQLATRAGVRQQTISAVENGKLRSELLVIFRIMAGLGLEISLQRRDATRIPKIEDLF